MKNSLHRGGLIYRLSILRIGILAAWLVGAWTSTWAGVSLDFESGLGEWKESGPGQIKRSLFGNAYYSITTESVDSGRLISPVIPVAGNRQISVSFRSQSSIAHSGKDQGSWVLVGFLDANGNSIRRESIICPYSADWLELTRLFAIPANAQSVQLQFRLQQSIGTVAWDAIRIELRTEPATSSRESAMSYRLVGDFQLNPETRELKSTGVTLVDLGAGSEKRPFYRYILPDAYCNSDELTYEVELSITPGWKPGIDHGNYSLFALGNNVVGPVEPDSFCLIVYQAKTILARLNGPIATIKADARRQNFQPAANSPVELKARFSAGHVTLFYNGEKIEDSYLAKPFHWPRGRAFAIGADAQGDTAFQGVINSFHLKIYEPVITAHFAGGNQGGYFEETGKHVWRIEFPKDVGNKVESVWSVIGEDGKEILSHLSPAKIDKSFHELVLPPLPYGCYRLKGALQTTEGSLLMERSFVITPALERGLADASLFGITTEIPLKPGEFDSVLAEDYLRRSAAAGNRWFRLWVRWDDVEMEKGKYEWSSLDQVVALAEKYGLKLYPCITGGTLPFQAGDDAAKNYTKLGLMTSACFMPADLPAWQAMLSAMSKRYQGRIGYYQIWNEPDARNGFYPFDPRAYTEVLKASAETIRAVDKNIKIGLGGFAAAMSEELLQNASYSPKDSAWGAKVFYAQHPEPYFDIVDVHYYSVNEPGQSWDHNVDVVREGKAFLSTVGDQNKPIWNSETSMLSGPVGLSGGWANVPYLSESEQAIRLVQWHVQSMSVGIQRNFWYGVRGDVGIVNSDFSPKPSYAALVNTVRLLQDSRFIEPVTIADTVRLYRFQRGEETMLIAWTTGGQSTLIVKGAKPSEWRVVDIMGNETTRAVPCIEITESPLFILSRHPITLQSMVDLDSQALPGGGTRVDVTLRNPSAQPTTFKVGCSLSEGTPQFQTQKVSADATAKLSYTFESVGGLLQAEIQTNGGVQQQIQLRRMMQKQFQLMDGTPLELIINQQDQIKIGGMTVDAQGRPLTENRWMGPKDLSARMTINRAAGKIQFDIKVTDNVVVPAEEGKALWDGDAVELFLNWTDAAEPHGIKACQVIISADGRMTFAAKRSIPGFEAKAIRSEDGYRISGSFNQPTNSSFGINLAVDDADTPAGRKTQAVWSGDRADINHPENNAVLNLAPRGN